MSNNNPTKTKACRLSSLILGHHHQGNLIKQPTSHGYSTTRSSTRTNRSTHSFHRTLSLKLMKRSRNQRGHFKTPQRDSHCVVQSSPYSTHIRQKPSLHRLRTRHSVKASANQSRHTSVNKQPDFQKHEEPTTSTTSPERQDNPTNSNSSSMQSSMQTKASAAAPTTTSNCCTLSWTDHP